MRRLILTLVALALSLSAVQQAHAWGAFWHRTKVDWYRNNCWPEPFNLTDRAAVREPFGIMIANGWQHQHTLDAYHFDAETQQLTEQGRQKLHWIVTQTPLDRRTVFVLAGPNGPNSQHTRSRLDAVQQMTAGFVHEGPLPQVLLTNSAPYIRPAGRVHTMNVLSQEAVPVPILPAMQEVGGE